MKEVIWSNTGTINYLLDLEPDELRDELVPFGYDREMLDATPDEELEDIIWDDEDMFLSMDFEQYESDILPKLSGQSLNNVAIAIGKGAHQGAGFVLNLETLPADYSDEEIELYVDNGNVYFDDGLKLYAIPKNARDIEAFIERCLKGAIDDELANYLDDDEDYDEVIDDYYVDALDAVAVSLREETALLLDDFCDFQSVPEVCEPFSWSGGTVESFDESLTEAKTNNPEQLSMELEEVKDLVDYDGTIDSINLNDVHNMSFYDFSDSYPEFVRSVVETFCKEMMEKFSIINADPEEAEYTWKDFDKRDWMSFINGAEKMIGNNKNSVQWERVYDDYYNLY